MPRWKKTIEPESVVEPDGANPSADKEPHQQGLNLPPHVVHTRIYSTAISLAYARAYDRGLELELDELLDACEASRRDLDTSVDDSEKPALRATATGLAHALVFRNEGAAPATFSV